MIASLGLTAFGPDIARLDPAGRLAQVKRLLGQVQALLVWDNFESVKEMPDPARATAPLDDAGCAELREFADWVRDHSRSTLIITSRAEEDWLGPVCTVSVGGLKRQEAAEYATHLLAPYPAARQRRELRSFGELLDWLNGHPLAMRLTLPRLNATGPAELLAGLRGTTPLPTAEHEGPARLSSLAACITYSFAHLSAAAWRLMPAVSLFCGVADDTLLTAFSAAEGVPDRFAGVSKHEWTALAEDAARVGLLTHLGAGIYRIHPALPGYLASAWRAENPASYGPEREASENALCAACAAVGQWLTTQIETGNAASAYAVIGLQLRTLGAMLSRALDRRAWADAENIVRAMDSYWDTRGAGEEAAAWADRILDVTAGPGQTPPESARSLWLYTTTWQANRQRDAGHPDQAAQTYLRVLAYLQDQPQTEWTRASTAVTYQALARAVEDRGRLDEADDWYRKALAIFEELGNRRAIESTYHQLGNAAHSRGRLDEADDWYRKSLAIKRESGNRPGIAITYHQLGMTARDQERLDEADDWYHKALTIFEELADRPRIATTYHHLGMTALDRGRLDEADDWSRRSLAINEELGNRPGLAGTYHQLGMTAHSRERLDEADDWYRRSLAINEELGNRPGMALTYAGRALLAEARKQPSHALTWMVRCVTLFDEFPHPATEPGPRLLARLARHLGMPALEHTWHQITGHPLPQHVRDYITSHDEETPEAEHDRPRRRRGPGRRRHPRP